MLSQGIRSHLPLIALATVSALLIFYLYRELQKAKKALVTEGTEECTTALCKEQAAPAAKRVRFEQGTRSSGGKPAAVDPAQPEGARDQLDPAKPQQPPTAAGATAGRGAFESSE